MFTKLLLCDPGTRLCPVPFASLQPYKALQSWPSFYNGPAAVPEVKLLAQSHTDGEGQSWDMEPWVCPTPLGQWYFLGFRGQSPSKCSVRRALHSVAFILPCVLLTCVRSSWFGIPSARFGDVGILLKRKDSEISWWWVAAWPNRRTCLDQIWGEKEEAQLIVVVQLLSRVRLFVTPWTAARQASLSITNSWSLLKLMCTESVMSSDPLILCHPLLLLSWIFPSIRVFSNELAHQVAKVLELQLQHQSFQWTFRVDFSLGLLCLVTLISEAAGKESQFRKSPPTCPEMNSTVNLRPLPGFHQGRERVCSTSQGWQLRWRILCLPFNVKKASSSPQDNRRWDQSPKDAAQGELWEGSSRKRCVRREDQHMGAEMRVPRCKWCLKKWTSPAAYLNPVAPLCLSSFRFKVSGNT